MKDAIWLEQGNPDIERIKNLCEENHVDTIIIHGVNPDFITILKAINDKKKYPVYWIFWGFELYYALGEKTDYPLIDNNSIFSFVNWIKPTKYNAWLRKLIHMHTFYPLLQETLKCVNFFCFWFYDDYLLLKKYFDTDIQYKYFQYSASYKSDPSKEIILCYDKTPKEIRVNHSASKTGNHDTLIELLHQIDKKNEYKKVFPLAYGNTFIRSHVIRKGKKMFGNQFCPITENVGLEEYLESLSKTGIAIFGNNRQEGGGNLFPLLKSGAKVFLRKNNPFLDYCKKNGYIVFSVEDDLKSMKDLQPLTREQMDHNAEIGRTRRVYYEDFMPNFIE